MSLQIHGNYRPGTGFVKECPECGSEMSLNRDTGRWGCCNEECGHEEDYDGPKT